MKSKQLVLIGIALLCGLVSAIGIFQAMGNSTPVEVEVPKGPVLVATEHVDLKAELTEENVHVENWPLDMIPEGAATELDDVKGKFTLIRLRTNQAIYIEDVKPESELTIKNIPPGHKVINIKVPSEDLIGGLLEPGDRVDIIGNFNTRSRGGETTNETKTFLKGIRIFNIGTSTSGGEKNKTASASGIVGVLVTEKQSEKIVWARKNGEIRLALVGDSPEGEPVEDPDFPMGANEPEVVDTPEPKVSGGLKNFFDFARMSASKPRIDKSKLRKVKVYAQGKVVTTYFDEDGNQVNMPNSNSRDSMGSSMGMGMRGGMPGGMPGTMPVGMPAMPNGAVGGPPVDYEGFDGSADLPNGIEEDQYQGE